VHSKEKKENEMENHTEHAKNEDKENHEKKEKTKMDEIMEKMNKMEKEDLIKNYILALKSNEEQKKVLEQKEKESNEYLDKYKRSLAEIENLRKRTIIEKQDLLKYSNFTIITDLVILLDDFQRAIDSAKKDEKTELKHFVDGVDMIEKQFIDLLYKKYGVVKFGEPGEEFDPKIHMALTMEKGDYQHEKVLEVFRKGYKLHDRVIRPAEVKIGRPSDKQAVQEEIEVDKKNSVQEENKTGDAGK